MSRFRRRIIFGIAREWFGPSGGEGKSIVIHYNRQNGNAYSASKPQPIRPVDTAHRKCGHGHARRLGSGGSYREGSNAAQTNHWQIGKKEKATWTSVAKKPTATANADVQLDNLV